MRRFLRSGAVVRLLLAAPLAAAPLSCGGGGGGGGRVPGPQDLSSVTPTPVSAAKDTGPGDFAADYLRATHFDRLLVEVDYPSDRPPAPAALDLLQERLAQRCDKPGGVTVLADDAIPVAEFPPRLAPDDLAALEDAHRDAYSDLASGTVAMYALYVHGHSSLDTAQASVIGLSYRGGSFAIFIDRAPESAAPPAVTPTEIEAGSIVHEAGHLLGLVNGGVPMVRPHEEPTHRYHDGDPSCVMYFVINVPFVAPDLGDPDFMQFDPKCVEDLEAFGGLGPVPATVLARTLSATDWGPPIAGGICPCELCRPKRAK